MVRESTSSRRKTCQRFNEPGQAHTRCHGDGAWDLNQARTANTVNEITGITESAGPSWATPAYNAAGNMTTVPQPSDPTKTYTATYDAWNRLVKVVDDDTDDTVAEYAYDGANRRIVQKSYDEGDLQETRHLYYTQPSQWQVVEERVEDDADPDRQFVWGLRYIDDLVLRDRDTNGDGSLNERLFALQDANWNLTALVDTAGDVQERCAYSAYGTPMFLTPAFGSRVSSSFDWETLYAGYRWETATELFHVRHRVLNSVIGSWCQQEPREFYLNLTQYVQGQPLVYADPFGLAPIPAIPDGMKYKWPDDMTVDLHRLFVDEQGRIGDPSVSLPAQRWTRQDMLRALRQARATVEYSERRLLYSGRWTASSTEAARQVAIQSQRARLLERQLAKRMIMNALPVINIGAAIALGIELGAMWAEAEADAQRNLPVQRAWTRAVSQAQTYFEAVLWERIVECTCFNDLVQQAFERCLALFMGRLQSEYYIELTGGNVVNINEAAMEFEDCLEDACT